MDITSPNSSSCQGLNVGNIPAVEDSGLASLAMFCGVRVCECEMTALCVRSRWLMNIPSTDLCSFLSPRPIFLRKWWNQTSFEKIHILSRSSKVCKHWMCAHIPDATCFVEEISRGAILLSKSSGKRVAIRTWKETCKYIFRDVRARRKCGTDDSVKQVLIVPTKTSSYFFYLIYVFKSCSSDWFARDIIMIMITN